MIFTETALAGAWIVDMERVEDARGFFARSWCGLEFQARGLNPRLVQCNVSFNKRRGTLRGMHYQAAPHREAKLIRCTRGAIHDVIIDLRVDSPAYKRHVAVVLDADSRRMLYVPEGFAHGFQTLEDETEVFYQMSEPYAPDHARGVRWNDPTFGISWPEAERTISERDQRYADFAG
ncbi:MAG: dTDP-4-dehydrorhamnose 3,5-epimerase [Candidatus Rokuibacteriota bacterium]